MSQTQPDNDMFRRVAAVVLKLLFFGVIVFITYLLATSNWKDEAFYATRNGKEALFLIVGAMVLLHLIRMFD